MGNASPTAPGAGSRTGSGADDHGEQPARAAISSLHHALSLLTRAVLKQVYRAQLSGIWVPVTDSTSES